MEQENCTQKNNKIIYDTMLDIHKHIFEQQKYAETKNNILLSIVLALLVVYARFFLIIKDDILSSIFCLFLFFIPLLPLMIALYSVLESFEPNLTNKEKENIEIKDSVDENIYFFKYLYQSTSDKLLEIIKDKIACGEITNSKQLQDLANQICVLSDITARKHTCFNRAMKWLKRLFWFVVIVIVLYLSIKADFIHLYLCKGE